MKGGMREAWLVTSSKQGQCMDVNAKSYRCESCSNVSHGEDEVVEHMILQCQKYEVEMWCK